MIPLCLYIHMSVLSIDMCVCLQINMFKLTTILVEVTMIVWGQRLILPVVCILPAGYLKLNSKLQNIEKDTNSSTREYQKVAHTSV